MHRHFVLHTTPANGDSREFIERRRRIDKLFRITQGDRVVVSTEEMREELVVDKQWRCGHIIVDPVEVANTPYNDWVRVINRNEDCTQHGRYPATECITEEPNHQLFSEDIIAFG